MNNFAVPSLYQEGSAHGAEYISLISINVWLHKKSIGAACSDRLLIFRSVQELFEPPGGTSGWGYLVVWVPQFVLPTVTRYT